MARIGVREGPDQPQSRDLYVSILNQFSPLNFKLFIIPLLFFINYLKYIKVYDKSLCL
jgi:hypothetical protein